MPERANWFISLVLVTSFIPHPHAHIFLGVSVAAGLPTWNGLLMSLARKANMKESEME
jgi:hypothetical protein